MFFLLQQIWLDNFANKTNMDTALRSIVILSRLDIIKHRLHESGEDKRTWDSSRNTQWWETTVGVHLLQMMAVIQRQRCQLP